jgi:hypothetical protein
MYSWPYLKPETIVQALRRLAGSFGKDRVPAAEPTPNDITPAEPRPTGAER